MSEVTETTEKVDSLTSKVKAYLEANPDGLSASQLAFGVGLTVDESTKEEIAKACKKIRVAARKVISGRSTVKNGRNAIYKI